MNFKQPLSLEIIIVFFYLQRYAIFLKRQNNNVVF